MKSAANGSNENPQRIHMCVYVYDIYMYVYVYTHVCLHTHIHTMHDAIKFLTALPNF